MIFTLTINAIIIIIMNLYMYLLTSLYLLRFIVFSNFLQLECISSILNVFIQFCISTVLIEHIFVYLL